jgi:lipopolysaccharide/colanic/teichoic acid biosynthesis glycosyltransferase
LEIRLVPATGVEGAQAVKKTDAGDWLGRVFDLVVLLAFSPLILIVAIAIALAIFVDSPGSVLFASTRIGRDGRPFTMYKFRKMRAGARGYSLTVADDERFTPIGRFLAATRLDELPQVWNVIRGDMRLVGPRPELDYFVLQFADQYEEILTVTPGITGVAQLQVLNEVTLLGGGDPARAYCERVLPEKIRVDLRYVRSRSLLGDVAILWRTGLMPLSLAWRAAGSRSSHLRDWASAAGLACIVVVLFAVSSSNIF